MKNKEVNTLECPCAKFIEYTRFVKDEWIRDDLIKETGSKEAFVIRAEDAFRQQVIMPSLRAEGTAGKTFLLELRAMGYDDGMIARALAAAWFDHSNHFGLPRIEQEFLSVKKRIFISVVLTLIILLVGLMYILLVNKTLAFTFIYASPLISIFGILVATAIYFLTKFIAKPKKNSPQ